MSQESSQCRSYFGLGKVANFRLSDLLEGYSTLVKMSEEEFDEQFYNLAASENPITGETRYSKILRGEDRLEELPQLSKPMRELFKPPRSSLPLRCLDSTV